MVFTATGKSPGVYIDEIQLPGPIVGVGTSTAAFLGPARRGPANTPVFLTNWTEFLNTFGVTPAIDPTDTYGPYMVNPDVYVTHAVNGFFANGGTACYFVRVTDAGSATATVTDQAGNPAFTVQANDPGVDGNSIQFRVTINPAASTTAVVSTVLSVPFTTASGTSAMVAAGANNNFKKNDLVQLVDSTGKPIAFATVASTTSGTINFTSALSQSYTGGTIQKGNLIQSASGNTAVVDPGDEQAFLPGTGVIVSDGTNSDTITVLSISSGTITFTRNLNVQAPLGNGTIQAVALNGDLIEVPFSSAGTDSVTLTNKADGANFTKGELVTVYDQNNNDQLVVNSVSDATITFTGALQNAYPTGGTVSNSTTANPKNTQSTLRVASINNLVPSLPLTVKQGSTSETVVVLMVDRRNQILYLANPLVHHYTLDTSNPITIASQDFNLTVTNGPTTETFNNLSMDPGQPNYYLAQVDSNFITLVPPAWPNTDPPPSNIPAAMSSPTYLTGGLAESKNVTTFPASLYETAIDTLLVLDDVNLICVPDSTTLQNKNDVLAVQIKIIEHCDTDTQDRFALLDPPPNLQPADIKNVRANLSSDRGFGALFYPRIKIPHPIISGTTITVPPSGHLAGVFARVDNTEGVFKAPGNEKINGAVDIEFPLQPSDMGSLNDASINVIRNFKGSGVLLWGARTIAPVNITQWRYLNIRRLLLYIEKSLEVGLQSAVFQPNTPSLRQQLSREVNAFLMTVYNSGAFAGATPATSFKVRVDAELNPPQLMALGQLAVEVIVYPASPAEFIVIQMISDPTGVALTES